MNITDRTTHDVQQGTGPWLRLRQDYDTASEAPAAIGVSRYVTRAQLMRQKHTGVAREPDAATLGKFAAGHAAEAAARPMVEELVAGELFPVTMTATVDGLRLLASLDGITLDGDTVWETKLWNEDLAAAVRASELPEHYTVQMDQELLVSGARRCLFTCTDGTPERFVSCWYEPTPERFEALVAGWRQFRADLACYTLPPEQEPAAAEPMETLPAVSVRLDGALQVTGNLPTFAEALRAFIAKIPSRPSTDNDFATCEAACKALKRAEETLDAAESNALASITNVEEMRRAVAECRRLARDTRLAAEKLVDRRKLEIKEQAVMKVRQALDQHVAALNAEIAPMRLASAPVDFAGAIKGLKSLASIEDKLATALAAAKIHADGAARGIRANIATFKQVAEEEHAALFPDLHMLVHKPADDFAATLTARISAHQAAEAAREAARKKAAEEAARAAEAPRVTMTAAPAVVALPVQQAAAQPAEEATLSVGEIGRRLGFTLPSTFIESHLGVKARAQGAAKMYRASDFERICSALIQYVERVRSGERAAA
jgi:putative phage-type endonuclease